MQYKKKLKEEKYPNVCTVRLNVFKKKGLMASEQYNFNQQEDERGAKYTTGRSNCSRPNRLNGDNQVRQKEMQLHLLEIRGMKRTQNERTKTKGRIDKYLFICVWVCSTDFSGMAMAMAMAMAIFCFISLRFAYISSEREKERQAL